MSDLINEMKEVLSQQEIAQRHSYFQLKYFLIGKEPTIQSKMWQCLKELKNRQENIENMVLEKEELKDKLELLDIGIKRISHDMENIELKDEVLLALNRKESEIKIRQFDRQKKALEKIGRAHV